MPTFHPAYLLRNPGDKRLVWAGHPAGDAGARAAGGAHVTGRGPAAALLAARRARRRRAGARAAEPALARIVIDGSDQPGGRRVRARGDRARAPPRARPRW